MRLLNIEYYGGNLGKRYSSNKPRLDIAFGEALAVKEVTGRDSDRVAGSPLQRGVPWLELVH